SGTPLDILGNNTPGAVDTNYSWKLPFTLSGDQFRQQHVFATYPDSGYFPITLSYTSPFSGCIFDSTLVVRVDTSIVPIITLDTVGPKCTGDLVIFTPDTTNAGSGATFQWFVNQTPVANTFSYQSSTLSDGDTVGVILFSTAAVCVPPFDTAFVVM